MSEERVFDILCPKCGQTGEALVTATVWALVTPDGSADPNTGDVEFYGGSQAACPQCGHGGFWSDFVKGE